MKSTLLAFRTEEVFSGLGCFRSSQPEGAAAAERVLTSQELLDVFAGVRRGELVDDVQGCLVVGVADVDVNSSLPRESSCAMITSATLAAECLCDNTGHVQEERESFTPYLVMKKSKPHTLLLILNGFFGRKETTKSCTPVARQDKGLRPVICRVTEV